MKKVLNKTLLAVIFGVLLGLIVKFFIVDLLRINGTSMEPTLFDGDLVLENKLAYGFAVPFGDKLFFSWNRPKVGEIVIYLYQNRLIVKRCVAVQGMALEYSAVSGYTVSVGEKTYPLTEEQYHNLYSISFVPDGYIMAIGDNVLTSLDSRSYGFIPIKNVLGRIQ